jgi:CBS domain-containing protein
MKVRDVMTRPPLTIDADDDVALGLQVLAWGDVRHLPVLRAGLLAGVVSERDLLAHKEGNPRIGEIMTSPAQVAQPDDGLAQAARRMVGGRVGCLPVVDHNELIGIVTVTDVVAAQGGLGRQGSLRVPVRAAMTRAPLTLSPEDLLVDAIRSIAQRQVRQAPVVDRDRRVVGMLGDRDIRVALGAALFSSDAAEAARIRFLRVREVMSREPIVVHQALPLNHAAAAFLHRNLGALPVVDDEERIVGILSYVDVLRAFLEQGLGEIEQSYPA